MNPNWNYLNSTQYSYAPMNDKWSRSNTRLQTARSSQDYYGMSGFNSCKGGNMLQDDFNTTSDTLPSMFSTGSGTCSSPTKSSVASFDSCSSGYGSISSSYDGHSQSNFSTRSSRKSSRKYKNKQGFDYDDMRSDFDLNGEDCPFDPSTPSPYQVQRIYQALELLDKCSDSSSSDSSSTEITPRCMVKKQKKSNKGKKSKSSSKQKCNFCMSNGEEIYDHPLKDSQGRTVCPVLIKFQCKLCGQSGANAHTQKFCPLNPLTMGKPMEYGIPPGLLPPSLTFKKPQMQKSYGETHSRF